MTPPEQIIAALMGRPLVDDPMPLYHQLRSAAPLHRERNGVWYLTRYDDCERVLRSTRFGHHLTQGPVGPTPGSARAQLIERMFSFDDPPVHTEKRALVTAPFTAAAADRYAARTRTIVADLLASAIDDHEIEVDELATRLPVLVTCELLGIPDDDVERCETWVALMTSANQPVVPGELEQPANVAASESIAYFSGLLDERRSHSRDDVISLLVAAARDRAEFTPEDLIATIVLLMAAGFETTRYTIAGGLVALSESGTALEVAREQVRANGLLSNDAIEELLRHQGPIHAALARQSTQDEQFGPMTIPAGEPVVVMTAAANRDPAVYAAPDRLDLERQGPRALSFGHGPHYCLGAHLAKQEINEAISAILQRYDDIECVRPPQPKGSFNVRGPQGARLRLR